MPNLAGNCPDWDVIRDIADRHGLKVIEDSCDAIGATLRGTPTGSPGGHRRHQFLDGTYHHVRGNRWNGVRRRRSQP